jgi:hypothetical protein
MLSKTGCCGWDVWGELAGIGQDGHRRTAGEWPVLSDERTPTLSQDTGTGMRARAAREAQNGSYENR